MPKTAEVDEQVPTEKPYCEYNEKEKWFIQ